MGPGMHTEMKEVKGKTKCTQYFSGETVCKNRHSKKRETDGTIT